MPRVSAAMLEESDKTALIELLRELLAIPSVNAATAETSGRWPERQIARFVCRYMREQLGMKVRRVALGPGRPNLIGRWPAAKPGSGSLMLSAHMDTVNVEGMTVPPFQARYKNGRIYGRGACDTKGSLAAFLHCLNFVRRQGWTFDRDIYFVATAGEEDGCQGAKILVDSGFRVDQAIIGEPTGCQVAIAHKAAMKLMLVCRGRAAHAAVPDAGINAIYRACRAVGVLRAEADSILAIRQHPLLGRATLAATMISGGRRYNMIPDQCHVTLDMRLLPDQAEPQILEQLRSALAEHLPADSFEFQNVQFNPGLETDRADPLVRRMLAARRKVFGSARPVSVQYFADSGPFAASGASCVVFGPGDVAQAHAPDEFVPLDQLLAAWRTLIEFFRLIKR